tara:strand:+ start:344 stop:541 length:198 start_codon:yes stop_codon:yes gene_type:complete
VVKMTKYAWIENNVVRDVSFHPDPTTAYTPEIAALYNTLVPDEVGICWVKQDDGSFVPPVEVQRE